MLWKRVATAAVLVPVLVAAVLYGKGWPFSILVLAAALLCAEEYYRMFFPSSRDRWTGVLAVFLACASGSILPFPASLSGLLLCVAAAAFHFLPAAGTLEEKARRAAFSVLGVVYIGGFLSTWPRTILLPGGGQWVLFGIGSVAAGDTLAYFVGRAFGKRPLAPTVSPKKTVEGAAGGLAASMIFGGAYAAYFLPDVPSWFSLAASAAVGIAGQCGDLFESMLKRAADVKDSGGLLPGHGGLLDRVDGIIAAGPVLHLLAVACNYPMGGS
ncbi:MAG: phosphatidate cytidylyltransferase [Deltaproteobacteria bacterium]|nr:phosphatidate cytidylyltransferase [Deltaproteobacteria bacterium]